METSLPSFRLGNLSPAVVLALAASLAMACASSPVSEPAHPPGTQGTVTSPAEPSPERGGAFHVVGIRVLPHLNPWTNPAGNINFYMQGVYDQLLDYDYKPFEDWRQEYRVVPALAERWETGDATTHLFYLRRNVKWHDGQPFTAQDVKWSYEFVMDPANALLAGANLQGVASITTPDDFTLQIVTKDPSPLLPSNLANPYTIILPKHIFERGDRFETVAVGTGPFKVDVFDRDRGIDYVRNNEYWQPGRPYVEKWRVFPPQDEAGRTAAFIARRADVLKVATQRLAEVIVQQAPSVKTMSFVQDIVPELSFKLDRPPFSDIRVRQAIHLAIDRQAMIKALTFGDGSVTPPVINGVRKSLAIPNEELERLPGWRQPKDQDIAEARRLLAEAGYGSGFSFSAKVDTSNPTSQPPAEVVADQLRKIGVEMKVQPLETGVFNRATADGDYEALVEPLGRTSPEIYWNRNLHSKGGGNRYPIRDAELDRLIEAQAREFDTEKRRQTVLEMQRLLIRQMYIAPLISFPGYLLWHPYLHGWVDNQAANVGNLDWSQLWLNVADLPKDR